MAEVGRVVAGRAGYRAAVTPKREAATRSPGFSLAGVALTGSTPLTAVSREEEPALVNAGFISLVWEGVRRALPGTGVVEPIGLRKLDPVRAV